MSRTIGAALVTAVEAANVPLLVFVELDFSGGFVRVTNAPYAFDWNGYTWTGLGRLGGIDAVKEGASLEARGVALKLSGVPISGEGDSENISIALNQTYQGRDAKVWVAPLGGGDSHLLLPGTSGNYASTPDSAAVSITGDIDIRFKITPDDWTPAASGVVISKWRGGFSWLVFHNPNGSFTFYISPDGVGAYPTASAVFTFTANEPLWVKITRIAASGAVVFAQSSDGVTYTTVTTGTLRAGESLFDGTAPFEIGTDSEAQFFAGKVYSAEIRNGIDGEVVADFDASRDDLSSKGTPWTINKSGSDYARIIRNPFAILADPKLIFTGRMDNMEIEAGRTATIVLQAESRLADLERPRVRRFNGADQRAEYPDDAGLDFAEAMVEWSGTWGVRR